MEKLDFDSEKFKEVATKMIKELQEKKEERQEYFDSGKMLKDLEIVRKFLDSQDENGEECIDNTDVLYFPDKYPINERTLCKIVDTVFECAPHGKLPREEHNPFPHDVFEFEGLIFRIMLGQGTAMQIWDKKKYLEWQEIRKEGEKNGSSTD